MRISDWSSDVCSSDLFSCEAAAFGTPVLHKKIFRGKPGETRGEAQALGGGTGTCCCSARVASVRAAKTRATPSTWTAPRVSPRSEAHTSELQTLMRISYAVCCIQKTKTDLNMTKFNY